MSTNEKLHPLRVALRRGEALSDRDFDRLYPHHVRELSRAFWTPVRVAQRASELLEVSKGMRTLDVGAGVGKFCIVAAAATGAEVTGIEHREDLVRIARVTAERVDAPARFVHGDLAAVDWAEFDAFYFYNPFFENVHHDNHIDEHVELSARRFEADLGAAFEALRRARVGTRVVTYHGLGAELPPTYHLVTNESAGSDMLKLWVQGDESAYADPDASAVFERR
jgi:SAM-dependent methyltransferase